MKKHHSITLDQLEVKSFITTFDNQEKVGATAIKGVLGAGGVHTIIPCSDAPCR